jgi:hypothetical protein
VRLVSHIAILGVCLAVLAVGAEAEDHGHATAHAHVLVNPTIAAVALTPNVDLGTVQIGLVPGILVFRVDANVERVDLWCVATYLYKGNDPQDPTVDPIGLFREAGVTIEPTNAAPIQGGPNVAPFLETTDINGFTGWISDKITFESSQPGLFSQDVVLRITWDQPDPEKPRGEYSGWVIFWAGITSL